MAGLKIRLLKKAASTDYHMLREIFNHLNYQIQI